MAKYIDADLIPYVASENGTLDDYAYRYDINEIPAADVVPRAEVEDWQAIAEGYQKMFEDSYDRHQAEVAKIKAEVAREIFAEIEKCLGVALMSWSAGTPVFCIGFDVFAKLKKKYIGEQNDGKIH